MVQKLGSIEPEIRPQRIDFLFDFGRHRYRLTPLAFGFTAQLGGRVEAHLRQLIEDGFEVSVVKDATAAAIHPELGDGYQAALVNFGFIASGVATTDEITAALT